MTLLVELDEMKLLFLGTISSSALPRAGFFIAAVNALSSCHWQMSLETQMKLALLQRRQHESEANSHPGLKARNITRCNWFRIAPFVQLRVIAVVSRTKSPWPFKRTFYMPTTTATLTTTSLRERLIRAAINIPIRLTRPITTSNIDLFQLPRCSLELENFFLRLWYRAWPYHERSTVQRYCYSDQASIYMY